MTKLFELCPGWDPLRGDVDLVVGAVALLGCSLGMSSIQLLSARVLRVASVVVLEIALCPKGCWGN